MRLSPLATSRCKKNNFHDKKALREFIFFCFSVVMLPRKNQLSLLHSLQDKTKHIKCAIESMVQMFPSLRILQKQLAFHQIFTAFFSSFVDSAENVSTGFFDCKSIKPDVIKKTKTLDDFCQSLRLKQQSLDRVNGKNEIMLDNEDFNI